MGIVSTTVQRLAERYKNIDTELDEFLLQTEVDDDEKLEAFIISYCGMKDIANLAINALHAIEREKNETD